MDLTLVLELVAFAILMGLSAFFSSSETSPFSLSQLHQEQMRQTGSRKSELDLPGRDYETLAVSLLDLAKAIPRTGAVIHYEDIAFTVERGTVQALQEIRVRW